MIAEIQKAFDIVKGLGEKYKPKNNLYYLTNEDGYEIDTESSYCEDCIGDASIEFDACYQAESMPEYEDFKCCSGCGEIIHTSRIWSKQELLEQIDFIEVLKIEGLGLLDERNCFELMCILDETYGAIKEHEELCIKIANLIINL